ncbi:MAG: LPS-assembly protein LptD [Limisphaerales bacterium]
MTRVPACVAVASAARTRTENNPDSRESAALGVPAQRGPAIFLLILLATLCPVIVLAQQEQGWELEGLNQVIPGAPEGGVTWDFATTNAIGTNIFVKYGTATLMADNATVNWATGEVVADGHVRIESGDMTWIGEHIRYNFKTHQMRSEEFRTGKPPVFAAGRELEGDISNQTYNARHALVTTDDVSHPAIRVRASRIKIVPGKYVEMWNAVLYMDGVPTFYFPFYRRSLGEHVNNFNFTPGYSSAYGPYLLGTYNWFLGDTADGRLHLDYREKRGVGTGPELKLHLDRWGEAAFEYYYVHDQDPNESTNNLPLFGNIPQNRQQFNFTYQATPYTNLNVKAMVNYQTDPLVLHDFAEGAYSANPQPNTFTEVNKYWDNWSLDAETTPRLNTFFDQVERLPDVKLTGYRQQIFDTPFYYDSESSAGYYRKIFADTNMPPELPLNYSAARADTYHQLLLPWTLFGWLNVTPHAGGRFTYYSAESGPGATDEETYRKIFDTGAEASFKVSRLWAGATNSLLDLDGLRHVMEPSANYEFVPRPSTLPPQLPQFDTQLPSLLLLPIQFPDYNDIDAIGNQDVIRFGLRNTLQTKRAGQLDTLLDWNVMLDWNLKPNSLTNSIFLQPQKTFNDLYSDLSFKPRSWITLESQLRYDINDGALNLTFHQLTFTPNERWSWGVGHWYLRSAFLGTGENFITSTIFYRLNDNWGLRSTHAFDAQSGRLQDQYYTVYRDLRSWTGALTFRVQDNGVGPKDYTIAFTFSLKASPHYHVGEDTVEPDHLVGE